MFIQNSALEGPGALAELFKLDGLDCTTISADGTIPRTADGPVVILGGPQGANDDSARLRDQEALIRWCHSRDVPVLGICLGAQLAAKALGGRVFRGHTAEAGFCDDVIPDASSPLFEGATDPYTVFHWHQDTFELPPDSRRLAGSPAYRNQAFMSGSVVGLQFHLEVDAPVARAWLEQMRRNPLGGVQPRGVGDLDGNLERVRANLNAFHSGYKRRFFVILMFK